MTNVSSPEKLVTRKLLFKIGVDALERDGWAVERVARSGKASLRRITRGQETKLASIRTTQDTWIAFPRTAADDAWNTLADVDVVVAVSVDKRDNPTLANVHMIDADDMRDRFDRAYAARKAADHKIPIGRGVWVSLYEEEKPGDDAIYLVGAGAGLKYPAIADFPLNAIQLINASDVDDADVDDQETEEGPETKQEAPLTIAEAKRRLAKAFSVTESDIKITING